MTHSEHAAGEGSSAVSVDGLTVLEEFVVTDDDGPVYVDVHCPGCGTHFFSVELGQFDDLREFHVDCPTCGPLYEQGVVAVSLAYNDELARAEGRFLDDMRRYVTSYWDAAILRCYHDDAEADVETVVDDYEWHAAAFDWAWTPPDPTAAHGVRTGVRYEVGGPVLAAATDGAYDASGGPYALDVYEYDPDEDEFRVAVASLVAAGDEPTGEPDDVETLPGAVLLELALDGALVRTDVNVS